MKRYVCGKCGTKVNKYYKKCPKCGKIFNKKKYLLRSIFVDIFIIILFLILILIMKLIKSMLYLPFLILFIICVVFIILKDIKFITKGMDVYKINLKNQRDFIEKEIVGGRLVMGIIFIISGILCMVNIFINIKDKSSVPNWFIFITIFFFIIGFIYVYFGNRIDRYFFKIFMNFLLGKKRR